MGKTPSRAPRISSGTGSSHIPARAAHFGIFPDSAEGPDKPVSAGNKKLLQLDSRLGATLKHQLRLYKRRGEVKLRVYTTLYVKGVQSTQELSLPERERATAWLPPLSKHARIDHTSLSHEGSQMWLRKLEVTSPRRKGCLSFELHHNFFPAPPRVHLITPVRRNSHLSVLLQERQKY